MELPDDLDDYLRGDSSLSRQYRREAAPMPPHALDRQVLMAAHGAHGGSPCMAPLAFAASVLLSVALVLAIVFGPQTAKHVDNAPRVVPAAARADSAASMVLHRELRLYSSDPPRVNNTPRPADSSGTGDSADWLDSSGSNDPAQTREPSAWLADIAALRREGRNGEADVEFRRFRSAYPIYSIDDAK